MPTPGLSLFGFLDEQQALEYIKRSCVTAIADDAALRQAWKDARQLLGVATPNAGHPDIQPLDQIHDVYLDQVRQAPFAAPMLAGPWLGYTFSNVEIDALLAYQFHIDTDRSAHHCGGLSRPPTIQELLPICLPTAPAAEPLETYGLQQSMILKTRSLNVRTFAVGMFNAAFMGIQFGVAFPFAHVVRFNGRCYLYNGFHRALGIREAGGTHMPCIVRDVPTAEEAGILQNGQTFDLALLESSDPPTLAHFTTGRACAVQLRKLARLLHVSWADYVIPDE